MLSLKRTEERYEELLQELLEEQKNIEKINKR